MSNQKSDFKRNSSTNCFKKRLLRPVSTNKQSIQTTGTLKASCAANLKDLISIKSKYNEVFFLIDQINTQYSDQIQNMLNNNNQSTQSSNYQTQMTDSIISIKPKGSQFIKHQIKKYRAKFFSSNQDKIIYEIQKQNPTKSNHQQNFSPFTTIINKSCQQILAQINIKNLEQGLKFVYKQNQSLKKIIQSAGGMLGFFIVKLGRRQQKSKLVVQQSINGQETPSQLLIKQIKLILANQLQLQSKQLNKQQKCNTLKTKYSQQKQDFQVQTPKIKFKTIFTARKQTQQSQQSQLIKQQLEITKTQNEQLHKIIKQYQSKGISNSYYNKNIDNTKFQMNQQNRKQDLILQKQIQTIHKQLKAMYDQILNTKDSQIQKLKLQFLQNKQMLQKRLSQISQSNNSSGCKAQLASYNNGYGNSIQRSLGYHATSPSQNSQLQICVQQQFDKMKKGYNKKIQKLEGEIVEREKMLRKQLFKIQKDYQNMEWEKKVLLKKYQFLVTGGQ